MKQYNNYCKPKQIERADKLGAPIKYKELNHSGSSPYYEIPTTQEMIGWLLEQKNICDIYVRKNYFTNK